MNLLELIQRLQEAHAQLGNYADTQVRFESAGSLDDEGGTPISGVEIESAFQLVVIRG
jgi:hypothetical protein